MKKAVFGIIAFLVVFNFAAKIPAVSAAETQPNQIDAKDAAYLSQTFTVLRVLLADIELRLASPNGSQPLNKEVVSAGLANIISNLASINGTLAALESGPAIANGPVVTPQVSTPQTEQPPVAAATHGETPGAVLENTTPPAATPTANNEAAPQTAQASESFDYRKLVWPAVFTVIGIAAIGLWLRRKDSDEIIETAQTAGVVVHSMDEPKLPVELPAESLFPEAQPATYSPLRSVVSPARATPRDSISSAEAPITPQYKPVFLKEKPATTQRPVVRPPDLHPHAQK